MAGYLFWAQVAHGLSGSSDTMLQGQIFFLRFHDFIDLSYHFWENEVLLVKNAARVLE